MKKYLSSVVRPQRSIANLPAPAAVSENLKRLIRRRHVASAPTSLTRRKHTLMPSPEFARKDPGENE
jgi:hypothetical protein